MGFFEDFLASNMPEEVREAFEKEKAEAEQNLARLGMKARAVSEQFHRFIREADPDDVQMLEISIIKASLTPGDAPYMIGQIHSVIRDRGRCTNCYKPLTECMNTH